MTQLLPPKKEVALALLERSNVDVYLDPRAKGVVVPPQFRKEPRLILKIGLNMPVPIPDLRLDDESMSCTLSFNRSPFYCVVPWTSVFAMVGEDGRGMVWPDDVPQELAVKVVDPNEASDRGPDGQTERDGRVGVREGSRPEPSSAGRRGGGRASKIAQTDEASADRPSRTGGKKRKKKDEGRPVLVAVPPAPPSSREVRGEAAAGSERPRDIRQAPEQHRAPPSTQPRDGVSAVRTPSPPAPHSRQPPPPSVRRPDGTVARPKRELPPYLRVVK